VKVGFTVLLLAGASASALPSITIEPCVAVDASEVRRLTAIEVSSWQGESSVGSFGVLVGCEDGGQRLRLMDAKRGQVAERSIDLSAVGASDRDARARELALAIAELLRRNESAEQPAPSVAVDESSASPTPTFASTPLVAPWQGELGVTAAALGWTGGGVLFGADLTGRARFGRWFIGELRAGGRSTRAISLENGSMTGRGLAASVGLAVDVAPNVDWAGVSFGARLGVDWLRYAATDVAGVTYDGQDGTGVSVFGTASAFVSLAGPLRVTLDAGVGTALHEVVIRENDETLSGLSGVVASGALGLAARF
jgi:hypothetical protein